MNKTEKGIINLHCRLIIIGMSFLLFPVANIRCFVLNVGETVANYHDFDNILYCFIFAALNIY